MEAWKHRNMETCMEGARQISNADTLSANFNHTQFRPPQRPTHLHESHPAPTYSLPASPSKEKQNPIQALPSDHLPKSRTSPTSPPPPQARLETSPTAGEYSKDPYPNSSSEGKNSNSNPHAHRWPPIKSAPTSWRMRSKRRQEISLSA